MSLLRLRCHVGPAAIILILALEILVDVAHELLPAEAGLSAMTVAMSTLLLMTTLAVLAMATRQVRAARLHGLQSKYYAQLCELGACDEPDETKMLRRCVTLLVDVLECDAAGFVQKDPNRQAWRIRATAGRYASKLPKEDELPWGPGSFGEYIMHTTAQPVHVMKLAGEHRFAAPRVFDRCFNTAIAVRVHLDSHAYGWLIAVFRKQTPCDAQTSSWLRTLGLVLARYIKTRQKLTALQGTETVFLQLAEHIQDVFYVANADGSKVHYVSPAYERIWKGSAPALYNNPRSWLDAIHADDRDEAIKVLHDHACGQYYERTYRVVHPDGTVRWISDRSFPIENNENGVPRVAGLATDITEARRARDMSNQLLLSDERTARTRAETHIRTRDEVLAIVSHDLRSPLTAISLTAQQLQKRCNNDAASEKLALRIGHAVHRMERLVQDLLEVSRLESGVLRLERRNTTFSELWGQAAEAFETQAGHAVVKFAPLEVHAGVVCIDAMRVLQVLGNLISNAVSFTPSGGMVHVSALVKRDDLVVCVQDTGPGIGADQLQHIFEPFWQSSRRDGHGLGLGLHIAKGIVEGHGGSIGAHAVEPHGTAVWFSLPREMAGASVPEVKEVAAMDLSLN